MYRPRRAKYGNVPFYVDGIKFDSKREALRFRDLRLMEAAGEISGLERQVKFELIPAQREPGKVGPRGGTVKGKLLEREVAYIADFVYHDKNGALIVEDAKGERTKDYIIKRKLMLWLRGIRIKEV